MVYCARLGLVMAAVRKHRGDVDFRFSELQSEGASKATTAFIRNTSNSH